MNRLGVLVPHRNARRAWETRLERSNVFRFFDSVEPYLDFAFCL